MKKAFLSKRDIICKVVKTKHYNLSYIDYIHFTRHEHEIHKEEQKQSSSLNS